MSLRGPVDRSSTLIHLDRARLQPPWAPRAVPVLRAFFALPTSAHKGVARIHTQPIAYTVSYTRGLPDAPERRGSPSGPRIRSVLVRNPAARWPTRAGAGCHAWMSGGAIRSRAARSTAATWRHRARSATPSSLSTSAIACNVFPSLRMLTMRSLSSGTSATAGAARPAPRERAASSSSRKLRGGDDARRYRRARAAAAAARHRTSP